MSTPHPDAVLRDKPTTLPYESYKIAVFGVLHCLAKRATTDEHLSGDRFGRMEKDWELRMHDAIIESLWAKLFLREQELILHELGGLREKVEQGEVMDVKNLPDPFRVNAKLIP
ncbi:hypothetical protein JCM11641_002761 [Rhodosporidiobolus odoratus]